MRICFLADAGSINTRSWVDHFADRLGHDVHVISLNGVGELSPRVHLHALGGERGRLDHRGKLSFITRVRDVRRLVASVRPDLVVAYRVASYGYLGARVGFHPLVVVAQGERIVLPRGSIPKATSARAALRHADLIHSWAPHMARRLIKLGADPAKMMTCPRGIDIELFGPRRGGQRTTVTVVSTRTLTRGYHVRTLIMAFAEAAREIEGFTAALVGDGSEEEDLRALADRLGALDRIRFEGRLPNDRLPAILGKSAIYASASPSDGVSASLLEAMARGCFPVVRDNEANRHWITDGRSGFLIPADDPGAYGRAILTAWRDEALRAGAARENRATVEERGDLSVNARRIDAAYQKLVRSFAAAGS